MVVGIGKGDGVGGELGISVGAERGNAVGNMMGIGVAAEIGMTVERGNGAGVGTGEGRRLGESVSDTKSIVVKDLNAFGPSP